MTTTIYFFAAFGALTAALLVLACLFILFIWSLARWKVRKLDRVIAMAQGVDIPEQRKTAGSPIIP
jgi:hypothetical protein